VPWPAKTIVSLTFQVVLAAGASMTAVGGVLPTEIGIGSLRSKAPR
jgi:hypothetical protein